MTNTSNNPKKFSPELKRHFLEIVSTYNKYQEMMDRKSDIVQVAETLGGIVEAATELAVNEQDDWFDKNTVKRNMSELTKLGKQFDKCVADAKSVDQRLHSLYEDMGHIISRYYKLGEIDEATMKKRLGITEAYSMKKDNGTEIIISDKAYKKLKSGKETVGYEFTNTGHSEIFVSPADIKNFKPASGKGVKVVDTYSKFESVNESAMSEIDILAQQSKNLKEFAKKVFKEFPTLPKDKGTMKWLQGLFDETKSRDENVSEAKAEGKWVVWTGSSLNPKVLAIKKSGRAAQILMNKISKSGKYDEYGISSLDSFKKSNPHIKIEETVNEGGLWPKSKLADSFQFMLSDELRKLKKELSKNKTETNKAKVAAKEEQLRRAAKAIRNKRAEKVNEGVLSPRRKKEFELTKHGKAILKLVKKASSFSTLKLYIEQYLDNLSNSIDDTRFVRIIDKIMSDLGIDHRKYDNKPTYKSYEVIIDTLYNSYLKNESVNEEKLDKKRILSKDETPDGKYFVVVDRDTSGMKGTQDKYNMYITDKHLNIIKNVGSHPSQAGARNYGVKNGMVKEASKPELSEKEFLEWAAKNVLYSKKDVKPLIKKYAKQKGVEVKDLLRMANNIIKHSKDINSVDVADDFVAQVNEAKHGYTDSDAGYITKHNNEYKLAQKLVKKAGKNEVKFYDELEELHNKLGHPKYMVWLSNALRGYKVDMYKDPKIKNRAEAEEALFLLSK